LFQIKHTFNIFDPSDPTQGTPHFGLDPEIILSEFGRYPSKYLGAVNIVTKKKKANRRFRLHVT